MDNDEYCTIHNIYYFSFKLVIMTLLVVGYVQERQQMVIMQERIVVVVGKG